MNLIMPVDRYCLFSAPFDHSNTSPEALHNVRERAKAAGLNPELLVDNTQDYLLWAFLTSSSEYRSDMQRLDGPGLLRVVGQMIEDGIQNVRRLVAASAPDSVSFNPVMRLPCVSHTDRAYRSHRFRPTAAVLDSDFLANEGAFLAKCD